MTLAYHQGNSLGVFDDTTMPLGPPVAEMASHNSPRAHSCERNATQTQCESYCLVSYSFLDSTPRQYGLH